MKWYSGKHCTHVIECVVGSNKVVSAHEAHVEIPKVERFRMREGRKGERLASAWRPKDGPIMPQRGRALVYFRIPPNTCPPFSILCSVLVFAFLIHWRFTLFDGSAYCLRWVRSISMNAGAPWNLQGSRQLNEVCSGR